MQRLMQVGVTALALSLAIQANGQEAGVGKVARHFSADGADRGICQRSHAGSSACDDIRSRKILDAASAPFSAIGRVNHAGYRRKSHCTGTLVAPRVVLTAAHCLFDQERQDWLMPEEVVFVAGYQRQTFLAAQSASHYIMGKAQNQSVAKFNRELGGDWALIVLAEPIDGVSPFSLPNASTPPYSLNGLKMAGYAGLRPHVLSLAEDCGDPNMGSWPRAIILFCATMQGDSGAPVFRQGEKNLEIVGLVSAVRGSDGALQALVVPYPNFAETLARLLGDLP